MIKGNVNYGGMRGRFRPPRLPEGFYMLMVALLAFLCLLLAAIGI